MVQGQYPIIFEAKNYLGVDVDKRRIESAKKNYKDYNFKVIKDSIIPSKTNSFDYICIFATLHHIPDNIIIKSVKEFKRVLKPTGKIVVIEPVLSEKYKFNNWFMNTFDDGGHIRSEIDYKKFFSKEFNIKVHKKFRKFLLYNEIFFSAKRK